MSVQLADGTTVTKNGLDMTPYTPDDPQFVLNTELFEVKPLPGSTDRTGRKRLAREGEIVHQSDVDRWFSS